METLVQTYLQLWNETDADRRATLYAQTFTPDATYQDPHMQASGAAELDGLVSAVHDRFPELVFTPDGTPETVGEHLRFSWNLGPRDGAAVANGTDFVLVRDGRFAWVVGFLNAVAPGV